MSIDQVIENGEFNLWEIFTHTTIHYADTFAFIALGCMMTIFLIVFYWELPNAQGTRIKKIKVALAETFKTKTFNFSLGGVFFMVLFLLGGTFSYEDLRDQWEREDVVSFVDSLPEQKTKIEHVDFVSDGEKFRKFYMNKNQEKPVVNLTVLYVNEKGYGSYYHGEAIIVFDLNEGEDPYMSYKVVEKNLKEFTDVEKWKKGVYNPVIHLKKGTMVHLEKLEEK